MPASELLSGLAQVNLAAAAAILAVVVLRKPARARFGARLAYGLWLLPVLAGLAVLLPARQFSIAAPPVAETAFPALIEGPVADGAIRIDPVMAALLVWLAGVAVAALVMAELQRRFAAEVRKGVIGPAVVGVVAPRVVTPSDFQARFDQAERTLVLAHEQAHIARQHSRLNAAVATAQCLFWFNPLIHLAAHLMRIDQELACDEAVVTRFPDARGAYARALVKAQLAIRPLPLGCYWPSGTEHPLMERIAMLKRDDVSRTRRRAGGAALGLLRAAAGLAAWAAQPPTLVPGRGPTASEPAVALNLIARPTAKAQAATVSPTARPATPLLVRPTLVADRLDGAGARLAAGEAAPDQSPLTNSVREPAQPTHPTEPAPTVGAAIVNPNWVQKPTVEDLVRRYPERAMRLEQSGRVVLRCSARPDGSLENCQVLSETPAELGFGRSALELSELFKLPPITSDGASVAGRSVTIPVAFNLN